MQSFLTRSTAVMTACAYAVALISPLAATAQDDPDAPPASANAAGVGVARVSAIDGDLSIQRGDSSDALPAAPNAPVLGGDYVVSGDHARAEIQLDGYAAIRIDDDVQMRFTHLDPQERSVQLAAGTLELRLLRGTDGTTEIDTPSVTVKPQTAGSYRITVTPDGQTLVTVRRGQAHIVTPQAQTDLSAGTTLVAQGDAANPATHVEDAVAVDAFDTFNSERDRLYASADAQAAYVDPAIGGLEDLAADGRWVDDAQYGHVWVPAAVGADWAPYRDGRWVWEEGYGWTWVGNEAWGWAPYHYGSWFNSPTYGWCWYPPQPQVNVAVWRPALVAFVGFGVSAGAGFALGFAGGAAFANIGWVPLAPFEPYHPWWGNRYGGGPAVVNVTNVTNVTNINVYRNARSNAVTSVSSEHFIQGNFAHASRVTEPELRSAHVFTAAVPIVPTASNLRFTASPASAPVAVRRDLMHKPFAGNRTAVTRTPFADQRVALAATTHAAITPLHFKDAQTTPLAGHAYAPAAAGPAAAAPGGAWDRFNANRAPQPVAAPEVTAAHAATYHAPGTAEHTRAPEVIDGSTLRPAGDKAGAPLPHQQSAPAHPAAHEYKAPAPHADHAAAPAHVNHAAAAEPPKKAEKPAPEHAPHAEAAPHEPRR